MIFIKLSLYHLEFFLNEFHWINLTLGLELAFDELKHWVGLWTDRSRGSPLLFQASSLPLRVPFCNMAEGTDLVPCWKMQQVHCSIQWKTHPRLTLASALVQWLALEGGRKEPVEWSWKGEGVLRWIVRECLSGQWKTSSGEENSHWGLLGVVRITECQVLLLERCCSSCKQHTSRQKWRPVWEWPMISRRRPSRQRHDQKKSSEEP